MSNPKKRPTLDDVLDAYLLEVEGPTIKSAQEWAQRFPEHAKVLLEFVASWKLAEVLPANNQAPVLDVATFVEQGMVVAGKMLRNEQQEEHAVVSRAPIESLLADAKALGLTSATLAARTGMSIPLITKFHRRLLDPASIPVEAIDELARELNRVVSDISRYLAQPPVAATAAFHRAQTKPSLVGQEDFFNAVRSDPSLTEAQRTRWLSLEPNNEHSP